MSYVLIYPDAAPTLFPGQVGFAASTLQQIESGNATLTLQRVNGSDGLIAVNVVASGGTAAAGVDHSYVTQQVTWADGDDADKTVTVPLINRASYVDPRTIIFDLQPPTGGAVIGSPSACVLTIVSDDAPAVPGVLSLSTAATAVIEASGSISLLVTRTGGSLGAVAVTVNTANVTALAGTDYTAVVGGTLSWADGDAASKPISVPIINREGYNDSRAFSIVLSSPTGGATLNISTTVVTIFSDEAPPTAEYDSFVRLPVTTVEFAADTFFASRTPRYTHTPMTAAALKALFDAGGGLQYGDDVALNEAIDYNVNTADAVTIQPVTIYPGTFDPQDPDTYIVIRTVSATAFRALCPAGQRVAGTCHTGAELDAWKTIPGGEYSKMAKLWAVMTPGQRLFKGKNASMGIVFSGLYFGRSATLPAALGVAAIDMGDLGTAGSLPEDMNSPTNLASHYYIDRCVVDFRQNPNSTLSGSASMGGSAGPNVWIGDCWIRPDTPGRVTSSGVNLLSGGPDGTNPWMVKPGAGDEGKALTVGQFLAIMSTGDGGAWTGMRFHGVLNTPLVDGWYTLNSGGGWFSPPQPPAPAGSTGAAWRAIAPGPENQCWVIRPGCTSLRITNCFFQGSAETVFGSAGSSPNWAAVGGAWPSDFTFDRNYVYDPPEFNWWDSANWDGYKRTIKNRFESKNAKRWKLIDNIFSGYPVRDQSSMLKFTATEQGATPYSMQGYNRCDDISIQWCIFERTGSGILHQGYEVAAHRAPVAAIGADPGSIDNGTYTWVVTNVNAAGETGPSPISSAITITDKATIGQVALTIHAGIAGTTARRLYRKDMAVTSNLYKRVLEISGNEHNVVVIDNTATASLGVNAPAAPWVGIQRVTRRHRVSNCLFVDLFDPTYAGPGAGDTVISLVDTSAPDVEYDHCTAVPLVTTMLTKRYITEAASGQIPGFMNFKNSIFRHAGSTNCIGTGSGHGWSQLNQWHEGPNTLSGNIFLSHDGVTPLTNHFGPGNNTVALAVSDVFTQEGGDPHNPIYWRVKQEFAGVSDDDDPSGVSDVDELAYRTRGCRNGIWT